MGHGCVLFMQDPGLTTSFCYIRITKLIPTWFNDQIRVKQTNKHKRKALPFLSPIWLTVIKLHSVSKRPNYCSFLQSATSKIPIFSHPSPPSPFICVPSNSELIPRATQPGDPGKGGWWRLACFFYSILSITPKKTGFLLPSCLATFQQLVNNVLVFTLNVMKKQLE